ncbi:MAG: diguanylate cyclase [Nitrosomonas sp.]|nr:diguanylate cyclase [Nitrosomonas sp.]
MSEKKASNSSIIARETLRQLASLKIPPTPDNYNKLYDQIAGNPSNVDASTAKIFSDLVTEFPRHTPPLLTFADSLQRAVNDQNWQMCKEVLLQALVMSADATEAVETVVENTSDVGINWAQTIDTLLKRLDSKHGVLTTAKKRKSVNRVLNKFTQDSDQLHNKLQALIDSWTALTPTTKESAELEISPESQQNNEASLSIQEVELAESNSPSIESVSFQEDHSVSNYTNQLLELLAQILGHFAVMPLGNESLTEEAKDLAKKLHGIRSKQEMEAFISCFKSFCSKFDTCGEYGLRLQQGLLRLFNQLIDSTKELLADDQWIKDQFGKLQETMSRPLDLRIVAQAEHYLEEITERHEILSSSFSQATVTLKQLVTSLINNIEELSDATGEYHDRIAGYSEQISQADNIESLNHLIVEIMRETSQMQKKSIDYRNDLVLARTEVDQAYNKISQLESELEQMGEKVHEDHLTGILNRRGLDEAYEREVARANRQNVPLCYALLDIDNFKVLNDMYGHKAGDNALVYLANAVKQTTRLEDIVARYGGEEFVILLPNTSLDEAMVILYRVRRSLTKKFFLHENKRLLITFSAGLAEYQKGELQQSIFKRADEALYRAKRNGKNQILEALPA